jgi:hypothetical protein
MVDHAPRVPNDAERPGFEAFRRTPGKRRVLRRKRKPIARAFSLLGIRATEQGYCLQGRPLYCVHGRGEQHNTDHTHEKNH